MTIYQMVNLIFAVSIPAVVLVVIGRHVVSAIRSLRGRRFRFALFSVLAIAAILLLFAGIAAVWFGYGVSHSKKDIWSDLTILSISVALIYGASYGLWRLARFMDKKISGDAA